MYKNNGNRLLFIYNPNAGRGVVKNHISGIIETFCSHGYEVSVYATSEKGDASSCVKQKEAWNLTVLYAAEETAR